MWAQFSQVQDMYWLDGGHAGGFNTWITAPSILKSLAARHINIHIHVSPYQVSNVLSMFCVFLGIVIKSTSHRMINDN